jgi:hypothetical protein
MQCIFTFTAVLALAFASTMTAQAVTLNPRGLGQVLIYPYYTVNKNQDTLISIGNASDIGKAVRVAVNEGVNGRPVLELTVFLSAHDVWTARVSQRSDDGGAALFTNDRSCTIPLIPSSGQDFSAASYAGGGAYPADGGPTGIARTREGSIEVIAAADIVPGSALDTATTHLQNGAPNGGVPACTPGVLRTIATADVLAPSSGLFGAGSIVHVGEGTFFGYNADAISGFTDRAMITPTDGMLGARLDGAHSSGSAFPNGAIASVPLDNGRVLALDYARGIDAVSAVFMANAIHNEYLVDAGLGAATDWIVTFPTERFYTDSFYTGGGALAPFEAAFGAPGQSNIAIHGDIYDREEGFTDTYPPINGCGFICPGSLPVTLPYEVNALRVLPSTIQDSSEVLGSLLDSFLFPYPAPFNNVSGPGNAGWVKLDLRYGYQPAHQLSGGVTSTGTHVDLNGLPVTGFMVYNVINANAQPGMLANYGGAFPHRANVSCSMVNPPAPAQDPCS